VLFDRVAAAAVGKPLAALLRKRYPGHTTPEAIANAARHGTGVPGEISSLVLWFCSSFSFLWRMLLQIKQWQLLVFLFCGFVHPFSFLLFLVLLSF
jgi:hypothetical protein